MNEDRPTVSARELLRTESTVQRCIDYIDIAGRFEVGADFVSCVLSELSPTYQGCRALTFALARLSC